MAADRVHRRLAAILAADVVGYSRLMGADEEGTLARLKALRTEVIDPRIAAHRGRIVKLMGDGALVEFASAVNAVRCAVEVQRAVAETQTGVPEDRRILFRIGVNLGDIIVEVDDIHGEGVNVAARIEGLCEPGQVYVSGSVFEQVEGKGNVRFEDLGHHVLKNIDKPVRIFRLGADAACTTSRGSTTAPKDAPQMPDKPSIAVLPFQNMSGDPEQDYFADGIAEDIVTGLSRFHWFFVIARNSSFTYKGRNVDVRQVGRELGVRYVLEGSVRKSAETLRITAQLVEAATGNHLWAEKYDGVLADVFDLQDQITEGVVAAVQPSLQKAEIERARRKRPENLDAYDLYLRALPHAWAFTSDEADKAIPLLNLALKIDPVYAAAHGLAAFCHEVCFTWGNRRPADRAAAVHHARAVLASGTDDATALSNAGAIIGILERDYDTGRAALDDALSHNPNSVQALAFSARWHSFFGHFDMSYR